MWRGIVKGDLEATYSTDHESLISRADEAREVIANAAGKSPECRTKAIDAAFSGFAHCKSKMNKAAAARLLNDLGDDRHITRLAQDRTLEELGVLAVSMPGNKSLRKLRREREKQKQAE